MNGIHVEHLTKSYGGKTVLADVSFDAAPGRVTCIIAPSGTGKTTLLRILLGLEQADGGTVRLPEGCRWSVVFQEDRLLEGLDAMENLRFVLGPALDKDRAQALLAELAPFTEGMEPQNGKAAYYICKDGACSLPVTEL